MAQIAAEITTLVQHVKEHADCFSMCAACGHAFRDTMEGRGIMLLWRLSLAG
jgi:bacterioferritin-associated ferredoxin